MSSMIRLNKLNRLAAAVDAAQTPDELRHVVMVFLDHEQALACRERSRSTMRRIAARMAQKGGRS